MKYGITSGLTWDFTYNTDFSQVEADEQQINLSRYSLLFPEKRDFFLENSGIFLFGVPNAALGVQGGTTTSVFSLLNPRPNAAPDSSPALPAPHQLETVVNVSQPGS